MSAKIKYKGSEVSSVPAGQSATIHCNGNKFTDDIVIESTVSGNLEITENKDGIDVSQYATANVNVPIPNGYIKPSGDLEITENGTKDVTNYASVTVNVASGGGGECSGNHIIEVDTLPTENIDKNVLYKMGDSYYKRTKELKDVVTKGSSLVDMFKGEGATVELYYVDTKPTENIRAFNEETMLLPCYYVASDSDIFLYANGGWVSISLMVDMSNGGAITDASQATETGYYYALLENVWKTYGNLSIIEVDELPTENIDKSAIYCVKTVGCIDMTVTISGTTVSIIQWQKEDGLYSNIFNVDTLPTENIGETIKNVSNYYYYVTSEDKLYTYQGGAWVTEEIPEGYTLVMGDIASYYTYGSNGFELLNSTVIKDTEANACIKQVNSWGDGTKYLKYTLSDDGTYYVFDAGQDCTDKTCVIASEIDGIPVTQIESASGFTGDDPIPLTALVIPDTITSIGKYAFYKMWPIDVIVIGKGVTYIDEKAFAVTGGGHSRVFKLVYYKGTEEEWNAIDKQWFLYDNIVFGS